VGGKEERRAHGERVLVLYLKTGAGHMSMSKALADYYATRPEGVVYARAEDALPRKGFAAYLVQDGYRMASTGFPRVWSDIFELSKNKALMRAERLAATALTWRRIKRIIIEDRITRVVSAHFLLSRAAGRAAAAARRETGRRIPVATLVTDPYTVHPFWFLGKPRNVIVSTEAAKAQAVAAGCEPSRVAVLPLPVGRRFGQAMAAEEAAALKASLGLRAERPLVLVAGGGGGAPRMEEQVQALLALRSEFDMVVVCGKGAAVERRLRALSARRRDRRLAVLGYVDFMYELVCTADIIISKAGAASIMELLVQGKYVLIGSYLYGQEEGNVRFVVDNGFGEYHPHPAALARAVEHRLAAKPDAMGLAARLSAIGVRNGSREVGEYVLGL
jgi:UDP-N-acetylglucosamine:LPS N-acetylglucosamine transferase